LRIFSRILLALGSGGASLEVQQIFAGYDNLIICLDLKNLKPKEHGTMSGP